MDQLKQEEFINILTLNGSVDTPSKVSPFSPFLVKAGHVHLLRKINIHYTMKYIFSKWCKWTGCIATILINLLMKHKHNLILNPIKTPSPPLYSAFPRRSAHLTRLEDMSVRSEMNTAFSRFSSRIVFREPGRGWLSCRRDRHLTSSSKGREHKSNHCSLLPTAEWGGVRWHRRHNSALNVRHICLHSCGKISKLNLVGLEPGT